MRGTIESAPRAPGHRHPPLNQTPSIPNRQLSTPNPHSGTCHHNSGFVEAGKGPKGVFAANPQFAPTTANGTAKTVWEWLWARGALESPWNYQVG